MTVGSKNPFDIIKTVFHLSLSLILTLVYLHLKSNFVNTFLVPIFLTISEISGNR